MFFWTVRRPADGIVVAPDQRLPWPQTVALGVQHVVAMFGATVLGPLLMGFDPNVAVLISGVGTLIFFAAVGGGVPSYLGSSFSFISVVVAATGYAGPGLNANIDVALGGIIVCGAAYALIGLMVMSTGTGWVERLMPPVVTGSVVAVIGLNLASLPIKTMAPTSFDAWLQAVTFVTIAVAAVFTSGIVRRLLILVGLMVASLIYAVLTNGLGWGKPIDFTLIENAAWFGAPHFTAPVSAGAIVLDCRSAREYGLSSLRIRHARPHARPGGRWSATGSKRDGRLLVVARAHSAFGEDVVLGRSIRSIARTPGGCRARTRCARRGPSGACPCGRETARGIRSVVMGVELGPQVDVALRALQRGEGLRRSADRVAGDHRRHHEGRIDDFPEAELLREVIGAAEQRGRRAPARRSAAPCG